MVAKAVERSDGSDGSDGSTTATAPKKRKGFSSDSSEATVGGSLGSYSQGYAANKAKDLSSAC
jgi:hypothetical protein